MRHREDGCQVPFCRECLSRIVQLKVVAEKIGTQATNDIEEIERVAFNRGVIWATEYLVNSGRMTSGPSSHVKAGDAIPSNDSHS